MRLLVDDIVSSSKKLTSRITAVLAKHWSLSEHYKHTHTFNDPFSVFFPGLPGWAGTRKVKPIWSLLKQETVSGSGICWAICKSAPRFSRQITTPAPHPQFFTGLMPFLLPNNSIKALKGKMNMNILKKNFNTSIFSNRPAHHDDINGNWLNSHSLD